MEVLQTIVEILECYNNPIGIVSGVIALAVSLMMCKFARAKTMLIFACVCLALALLGFGFCAVAWGVDLGALWLILLPLQFFVITFAFWMCKLMIEWAKRRVSRSVAPD